MPEIINIKQEIEQFFKTPPRQGAGPGNIRSILYLLRRDLRDLTIPEEDVLAGTLSIKAPVLAATGIMIGFEVLGRIWLGENDPYQPEQEKALSKILEVPLKTSHVMVMFRNALAHGYQLEIHSRKNKIYRFSLEDNYQSDKWFLAVGIDHNKTYSIGFWELRKRFIKSVEKIKTLLGNPSETILRSNFIKVLPYLKPYKILTGPDSQKTVS